MTWCPEILHDIPLARSGLDRSALERRDPAILRELLAAPTTRVVELSGNEAPVVITPEGARLAWRAPAPEDLASVSDPGHLVVFLGRGPGASAGDGPAYVGICDLTTEAVPDRAFTTMPPPTEAGRHGLRSAGQWLPDDDAAAFATLLALAEWHGTIGRCGRCGAETKAVEAGWVRACGSCGQLAYPVCAPSIIVSVIDEAERLLIGRSPQWPPGRFSVLAGFVEPGESFEQTVAREVREETGVTVGEMRYLGSQPWPFPGSIMVGFTAQAVTTEIVCDPLEMAEARWVTREEYVRDLATGRIRRPTGFSISLRLIGHWLGQPVADAEEAYRREHPGEFG